MRLMTILGIWEITGLTLAALQQQIHDFEALLSAPREAIVTRAEATSRLAEYFASGDDILKTRMDALMKQFEGEAAFYKQYQGARIIVDLGKRNSGGEAGG